jgi:hypothetical protein
LEEPVIQRWDRVIHKGVRTNDGEPVGFIAAEEEGAIFVLASRFKEYRIPKAHVSSFDGSNVHLDLPLSELTQYRIA